jgi:hypothetical protein
MFAAFLIAGLTLIAMAMLSLLVAAGRADRELQRICRDRRHTEALRLSCSGVTTKEQDSRLLSKR